MDLDPDQQLAKDLSDHDLLSAMYDDSKNDLPKNPVARTGSRIRNGGGTLSIDTDAVPAATFSQAEVDNLRKLMAEAVLPDGARLTNIVHDQIEVEIPVPMRKPKPVVDAPKTIKALMKRPALAWAVLQGLKEVKLAGPWTKVQDRFQGVYRQHPVEGTVATIFQESDGNWALTVDIDAPSIRFNDVQSAMNEADRVLTEDGWVLA